MDEQKITLLFSLLVFARVEEDIAKQAQGFKTSFVHVRKSDLVKVGPPVPPLPEQRAIAGALGDVDALLGTLDRLIAKKRDLKQAAMQQLLTAQTRLPGVTGKWERVSAGEVGRFRGGNGFPLTFQGEARGSLPFFSLGHEQRRQRDVHDYRESSNFRRNTKAAWRNAVSCGQHCSCKGWRGHLS